MSIPQVSLSPWLIPAAMLAYGVLHSLTASLGLKKRLEKKYGAGFTRYYRLIYSLVSAVLLLPITALVVIIPDQQLYTIPRPLVYLTIPVQIASAALLAYSLKQTGALQFIGVPQALGIKTSEVLNTQGLYRYIRHPLYTFSLLIVWLFPVMTRNLLLLFISVTVYTLIGAILEERKMRTVFGAAYAEYQTSTPFMIPFLKK